MFDKLILNTLALNVLLGHIQIHHLQLVHHPSLYLYPLPPWGVINSEIRDSPY